LALSRRQTRVDHSQNVTCVCFLEGRKKKRWNKKKIKNPKQKIRSDDFNLYIARNKRKEGIFIYL
jgi:hypothetical protein